MHIQIKILNEQALDAFWTHMDSGFHEFSIGQIIEAPYHVIKASEIVKGKDYVVVSPVLEIFTDEKDLLNPLNIERRNLVIYGSTKPNEFTSLHSKIVDTILDSLQMIHVEIFGESLEGYIELSGLLKVIRADELHSDVSHLRAKANKLWGKIADSKNYHTVIEHYQRIFNPFIDRRYNVDYE